MSCRAACYVVFKEVGVDFFAGLGLQYESTLNPEILEKSGFRSLSPAKLFQDTRYSFRDYVSYAR